MSLKNGYFAGALLVYAEFPGRAGLIIRAF